MHRKAKQQQFYFSDRLKRQLAQIPHHPLTIVEAPSGFGKTTAVKEYLKANQTDELCEYWYTCLGEPAPLAWEAICELLANVNQDAATELKKLGMPTLDTLIYTIALLRDFHCPKKTYLVVDNYQLVDCDIPRELMSVFAMHGSPNLHMIFITQQLGARQHLPVHNGNIHAIESNAFFFNREGTASLFRMEGIQLSERELERVFIHTEGWVSAIRLQIINFEETGSIDHIAGIEYLVESAIWKRLAREEKEFLLSVSIMDSFSPRQAAIMLNQEILPEPIEELLKNNDFIRYIPDQGVYVMHSILQDYLRNRFYHHQPQEFQNRMLYRIGQSFTLVGQYYHAAQIFLKVGDFDALLSIPFNGQYLSNQKENNLIGFIQAVVEKCPDEKLCQYPAAMLMFGYHLFMGGQIDTYYNLCRLIELVIERSSNFNTEEVRRIKGEYELLTSLRYFNDLEKMAEHHKAAWEAMEKSSIMLTPDLVYTFGGVSILDMFWRESGMLENTLRTLSEHKSYYYKLTKGHGFGAASVMEAETMLMRGEDLEAEILCYKALYEARSYQQISVCLCAELVLARIAIMRGDTKSYLTTEKNIKNYAQENSHIYVLRMVDFCLSYMSLILGITENIAKWICDIESIKKIVYIPAVPFAQLIYAKHLLLEKRYNELYGISQIMMDEACKAHYMMPQVFHHIFLAIAGHSTGKDLDAQKHLIRALDLALPDQIYLPFAQQEEMLDPLLERVKSSVADKERLSILITLCERQERGRKIIRKALLPEKSPLTPREKEVAMFARERLTAKEIADKLYISEGTVKTILKNVYSKLDIHSKSELNSREF